MFGIMNIPVASVVNALGGSVEILPVIPGIGILVAESVTVPDMEPVVVPATGVRLSRAIVGGPDATVTLVVL